MHEILFKGKRVDNGEWVEGLLFTYNGKHCIQLEGIECDDYGLYPRCYAEVIPESISEFTSLTDKNGNKIFEGDIIAGAVHWLERMKNGVVAFRDGSYGLIWYRGDVEQFNPFTSMCNIEYEIIGNIHDNPELLKGEKNA